MEKVKVDGKSTMKLVEFDTIKVAKEKVPSQILDVTLENKGKTVKTGRLAYDILHSKAGPPTGKLRLDINIPGRWESSLIVLFDAKLEKGPKDEQPHVKLELVRVSGGEEKYFKYFDLDVIKIKTKLEEAMNKGPEGRELVMAFESKIRPGLEWAGILH